MTTITIVKTPDGWAGASAKDKEAYARWKKRCVEAEDGEFVTFEYWEHRSHKFNALHHLLITAVFDAQEVFYNREHLRDWLKIGAGHVIFIPGRDGQQVAIPDSTKFGRCDEEKFKTFHENMVKFLRSTRATRTLWPHLNDQKGSEMIESILQEFERPAGAPAIEEGVIEGEYRRERKPRALPA